MINMKRNNYLVSKGSRISRGKSLFEKFLYASLCFILFAMYVQPAFAEIQAADTLGKIIYVGTDCSYKVIQDAIDAAKDGDTIIVRSKFLKGNPLPYYENININKSNIEIRGEDKNTTIIDGTSADNTVTFSNVKNVNFSHLTVQSGINGIRFNFSDNNCIDYCNVVNNSESGINFDSGSNDNKISKSEISGNNGSGITFNPHSGAGNNLTVKDCIINLNNYGIERTAQDSVFSSATPVNGVVISCNKIFSNKYNGIKSDFCTNWIIEKNGIYENGGKNGSDGAILIADNFNYQSISNKISITGNEIYSNNGYGIYFVSTSRNSKCTVKYNKIEENAFAGIQLGNAKNNTIEYNKLSKNQYGILCSKDSEYNFISCNSLIENVNQQNAQDNGSNNIWDNRSNLGNYWSNYNGTDGNNDGVIDKAYDVPGSAGAKDEFPSVKPISTGYKISGYISPDFTFTNSELLKGFKVQIDNASLSTVTNEEGYFEISNVPQNITNYNISITKDSYLARIIENMPITKDTILSTKEQPLEMWPGDIKIDNVINMMDIMKISACFNSQKNDGKYNILCDFNLDGAINMNDIMIIAKHFNCTSEKYTPLIKAL